MMVVPWVLLLVVIVVATGMICWLKISKKGTQILLKSRNYYSNQSTVDQTVLATKRREKEVVYDEVKPNCAETVISLQSNISYTIAKQTFNFVMINF